MVMPVVIARRMPCTIGHASRRRCRRGGAARRRLHGARAPAAPGGRRRGEGRHSRLLARTWGGAPAALLIADQQIQAGYSGLYIGSYQLLGNERPGISGILT